MNNKIYIIFVAVLLLIVSACSTTSLKETWLNPRYQGNKSFQNILVLGISENETYRRNFEDSLTKELKDKGVNAEQGYLLFPGRLRPDKTAIATQIADKGFDAMIISKVTGRKTKEVVHYHDVYEPYARPFIHPYFGHEWYEYYSWNYDLMHEYSYTAEYQMLTAESTIYDTKTNELIWSADSETVVEGDIKDVIDSLVSALVNELRKKQVI